MIMHIDPADDFFNSVHVHDGTTFQYSNEQVEADIESFHRFMEAFYDETDTNSDTNDDFFLHTLAMQTMEQMQQHPYSLWPEYTLTEWDAFALHCQCQYADNPLIKKMTKTQHKKIIGLIDKYLCPMLQNTIPECVLPGPNNDVEDIPDIECPEFNEMLATPFSYMILQELVQYASLETNETIESILYPNGCHDIKSNDLMFKLSDNKFALKPAPFKSPRKLFEAVLGAISNDVKEEIKTGRLKRSVFMHTSPWPSTIYGCLQISILKKYYQGIGDTVDDALSFINTLLIFVWDRIKYNRPIPDPNYADFLE